ncbi:MAG: hypothetical protein M9884_17400 [Rhodocyclaceae bacterium]|nr:hypothetical protein [Rhodocyclaceae bacterium]
MAKTVVVPPRGSLDVDLDFWAGLSLWTFLEAANLLAGKQPGSFDELDRDNIGHGSPGFFYRQLKDAYQLEQIETLPPRIDKIYGRRVRPTDAVTWALTMGYDVPESLCKLKGAAARSLDDIEASQRELGDRHAAQDEWEAAQGRMTIDEAARRISQSGEDREDHAREKLEQAALEGTLAVYPPGATGRYLKLRMADGRPRIRSFASYLRCYVDDLNEWLQTHEPRIRFRLPRVGATEPHGAHDLAASMALPRSEAKEELEWVSIARAEAKRIIERDRSRIPPLFPSQELLAEEVAKILQKRGKTGMMRVPLTAAYIKRHALKGITSGAAKRPKTEKAWGK